MSLRSAQITDLPRVVEIYNAAIPGRQATADTAPVTVASREPWFREFDPQRRPLWLLEREGVVCGWLSLRSFYGRPAYQATVEAAVYTAPDARRTRVGAELLAHAIASDGHRASSWRPVGLLADGVVALGELVGDARARWMAESVPGAIVEGRELPAW